MQNHATMGEPDRWVAARNSCSRTDQAAIDQRCKEAAQKHSKARQRAANKGGWIMRQCSLDKHAYLDRGFPDALGNVWHQDGEQPLLCIPMLVSGAIVGVHLISVDGEKVSRGSAVHGR